MKTIKIPNNPELIKELATCVVDEAANNGNYYYYVDPIIWKIYAKERLSLKKIWHDNDTIIDVKACFDLGGIEANPEVYWALDAPDLESWDDMVQAYIRQGKQPRVE
jgi:hypothetical protein